MSDNGQYIVHDWAGSMEQWGRFTHIPTSDTLLCQGWMNQQDWDRAQLEYFKKYPGLVVYKCPTGPYRRTDDNFGTTDEICRVLEERLSCSDGSGS